MKYVSATFFCASSSSSSRRDGGVICANIAALWSDSRDCADIRSFDAAATAIDARSEECVPRRSRGERIAYELCDCPKR